MEEWGTSRRKSSRREEESKCVGGKKGGRKGGRWREIQGANTEREMMGLIRIKTVGFGQSRVRADMSVPTPHPSPVPSSSPNQPPWHMQGASMTHKQTAHGCAKGTSRRHPPDKKNLKKYLLFTYCFSSWRFHSCLHWIIGSPLEVYWSD